MGRIIILMRATTLSEQAFSIRPTGAVGGYEQWLRGEKTFAEILAACPYAGIYQLRPRATGKIVVKMVYSRPTNPQTVPQMAWRTIFSLGVIQYRLLTPTEKMPYTERAKRLKMSAFNVYMRDWLKAHAA